MSPCEQLSTKEIRVATMVWQGMTNPEIASVFGCTEQVIKNQLRSVFDKLGVWSRLELALYIASHGGAKWAGVYTHLAPRSVDFDAVHGDVHQTGT
ncbi:MAG TPA: helix-turn-helix transcriptional regulator [Terriglobales bacterium]|nr:helix-turn-helix transcriptional regulator [Terriglobales bacterium]